MQRLSGRGERPKEARALTDRDPAIEVVTDGDAQPRATPTAGLRANLQHAAGHTDRVIARDDAGLFVAENRVEIGRPQGDERTRRVARGSRKRRVVLRYKALREIPIRRLDRRGPRHPQLVHQTILKGAIEPLTAAAGLRRVSRNVLDPQPRQRPADLRALGLVDRPPGRRRVKRPMRAVGVQRHRDAFGAQNRRQARHHRLAALARIERRLQHPFGRVIGHGNQAQPGLGIPCEPRVHAAIEMQQLAAARARLTPATVAPPRPMLLDQARRLERVFQGSCTTP